jgi:CRP-like cAMP-binding protein
MLRPCGEHRADSAESQEFGPGETICRKGDDGDSFYVIGTGEAEVVDGDLLVTTIGPGEGFGEISLLRDTARTATVRARISMRLYTLERTDFLAAVTGYASSTHTADELVDGRLAALRGSSSF